MNAFHHICVCMSACPCACTTLSVCLSVCRWLWSEVKSWVNLRRRRSAWSSRRRRSLRRHTSSRWSTRTRSGTSSERTHTCIHTERQITGAEFQESLWCILHLFSLPSFFSQFLPSLIFFPFCFYLSFSLPIFSIFFLYGSVSIALYILTVRIMLA